MRERAPAFQAYAADLLADYAGLTPEQFGLLMRLLCFAWREVGLPNDPAQLAQRLGLTRARLERNWPAIAPLFVVDGDRLVVAWMEEQRTRQAEFRARQAENGRRGGRPRAARADANPAQSDGKGLGYSGLTQTKARKSSASSSASASASAEVKNPSAPIGAGDAARVTWLTPFLERWQARYGGALAPGRAAKSLARIVEDYGPTQALLAWGHYLDATDGRYATPERFAGTIGEWGEPRSQNSRGGDAASRTFATAVDALREDAP